MILIEPKVIKLAETRVDRKAVESLLKELGGGALDWWSQKGEAWKSDSELLIEVAGRTCYESFGTGLNPNITRVRTDSEDYFRNVLEKGDGSIFEHSTVTFALLWVSRVFTHELIRHRVGTAYCLSGDTLVYSEKKVNGLRAGPKKRTLSSLFEKTKTPHGRSRIKLLRLRSLNESSKEFETSKVQDIVYSGRKPLYEVELEGGYKCKMSLDHTIYTDKGWFRLGDIIEELKQTDRTLFRTLPVKIAVNGYKAPATALVLDDGTLAYRNKDWIETQVRSGKTYNEMGAIAGASGVTVRVWAGKLGLSGLSKSLKLYARAGNKGLHYRLSKLRTLAERAAISERMKGPLNHRWKGGHTIHQVPIDTRRRILRRDNDTCQLCGKSFTRKSLHIHHIDAWEPQNFKNYDNNLITLCKFCHGKVNGLEAEYAPRFYQTIKSPIRPVRSSYRHRTVLRPRFASITNLRYAGDGDTYDIVLSGPHHNFLANGIVVHNSQESLRYVRIREIKMPAWNASVPAESLSADVVRKMSEAIKDLEARYNDIVKGVDWDSLAFDQKKRVTSALRRMLPQGLSTSIIFTANHRTLRWLIEMRTDPGAEYEIRKVFGQIGEICLRDYPLVYKDFKKTSLQDGTFQYKPTLRSKV